MNLQSRFVCLCNNVFEVSLLPNTFNLFEDGDQKKQGGLCLWKTLIYDYNDLPNFVVKYRRKGKTKIRRWK